MDKLLIVDGSNLLFQMFYGMPSRIAGPQGQPIQGTLGFVGALLKILRWLRPSHAAVVFDGECRNPRTLLDENYKANRPDYSQIPPEETPFAQLPDIFAALSVLGIPFRETEQCEADDWIAGFAKSYGRDTDMVIVSQDSDFFQLITDRVCIYRYRGKNSVLWDREFFQSKLGILPEQYAAYKALTGDTADNIRGADRIGPKTAAVLMNQFGALEILLARAEEIRKPSIRESVLQNAARIRKNHALIQLDGAVPPFSPAEMTWQDRGLTTGQVLHAIGLR